MPRSCRTAQAEEELAWHGLLGTSTTILRRAFPSGPPELVHGPDLADSGFSTEPSSIDYRDKIFLEEVQCLRTDRNRGGRAAPQRRDESRTWEV